MLNKRFQQYCTTADKHENNTNDFPQCEGFHFFYYYYRNHGNNVNNVYNLIVHNSLSLTRGKNKLIYIIVVDCFIN